MHKRGLCRHAVSVCLCVCLSVTFVNSVKMNKHIFKIFPPSGSDTILVFSVPNVMAIFWRGPSPLTGASNAGQVGYAEIAISAMQYLDPPRAVTLRPLGVINTASPDRGKL